MRAVRAECFQQMKQHGGLAHARLSDQADKSAVGFDAVVQGSQGFLVGFAQVKKSRIRSYTERLFLQPKKIQIQGLFSSPFRVPAETDAARHDRRREDEGPAQRDEFGPVISTSV